MNRDQLIEQLIDALAEAIKSEGVCDFKGKDSIALLKALYRSQAEDTRNDLEREKFQFIEDNRRLLVKNENPGPDWLNGTQGVGRRLLDCDETANKQPVNTTAG